MNNRRILDVNINRALEGLRVIEDIARFYNNNDLYNPIRDLRHDIVKLRGANLIKHRNIEQDSGRDSSPTEKKDIKEISLANFSRVKESLRVIEELSESEENRKIAQKIRFSIYSIEQQFFRYDKISLIKGIYPIVTNPKIGYKDFVKELIDFGITVFQLRIKNKTDREYFKIALEIRDITPDNVLYIIDDRVDICMAVDCDGVHLGQDDIEINVARNMLGPGYILGKSTHNPEQVKKAMKEKPDYIGIGPIYPTKSKEKPDPVVGVDIAREMQQLSSVKTVCIGGIKDYNIKELEIVRCDAIAVMSFLTDSNDVAGSLRILTEKLK